MPTDYTDILDSFSQQKQSDKARATTTLALDSNPDEEAGNRRIAAYLGAPVDAVRALPAESKRAAALKEIEANSATSPILQKKYSERDFAELAHDDSGALSAIANAAKELFNVQRRPAESKFSSAQTMRSADFAERVKAEMQGNPALDADSARRTAMQGVTFDENAPAIKRPSDRTVLGTVGDVGVVAAKSAIGLPQALVGLADIPTMGYAGKAVQAIGIDFKAGQEAASAFYSDAQQEANAKLQEAKGFVDTLGIALKNPSTLATATGESLGQMLGGAAVGRGLLAVAPKVMPWLAAAIGEGVMGGGAAAEQTRSETDDGLLTLKQDFAAVMSGVGTTLFSVVGGKMSAKLGIADIDTVLVKGGMDAVSAEAMKKGFVRRLVESGVSEGLFEEMPQSVQEQMWQNFAKDKPIGQGVGNAAAMGLLTGSFAAGAIQSLHPVAQKVEESLYKASAAAKNADALGQMIKTIEASKMLERSPETLTTYAQELVNEGVPNIHIEASKLVEAGIDMNVLAQVLPSVAAQLGQEQLGGDLVIPTSELLVNSIGQTFQQVLIDHARTDVNGMSREEAKVYMQEKGDAVNAEIERVMGEQAGDATYRESKDKVQASMLANLNEMGRFNPKVNEHISSLFSTHAAVMGARTGMTPEAFAAKYPLRFENKEVGGKNTMDQFDQAGALITDTSQFKSWFGDSQVVGSDGAPAVAYHSTKKAFTTFDQNKTMDGAFWFTTDKAAVDSGEVGAAGQGEVMPVYLSAKKLAGWGDYESKTYDQLIAEGFDGVKLDDDYIIFSPTQIKSATGNNGNFDPNDANILHQSVSTRVPTGAKRTENPLAEQLVVDFEAVKRNPVLIQKFAEKFDNIISLRTRKMKDPAKRLEAYIEEMKDNLIWLHDSVPADIRERSKLWYDGARNIVDRWVGQYENRYTDVQLSAVMAVMSPQLDWFANVTLAERIVDVWDKHQNTAWTPEMSDALAKTAASKSPEIIAAITGKTLAGVIDSDLQAYWIAAYDLAYNPRDFHVVTPEGDFVDLARNLDGKPKRGSWANGFSPIAKAVSVLKDNSLQNISDALGGKHKVRNFYNNIYAPNATDGSVTADTHAVAAALLLPLSGTSQEVIDNFGAAGGDSNTGITGSYAIYAEAYRRAAVERGLLAREMQSIAWEAVRGLFSESFKSKYTNKKSDTFKQSFDKIWKSYHAEQTDIDAARKQVVELAGGVTPPDWYRPDSSGADQRWSASYSGELLAPVGVGGATGRGTGGNNAAGSATFYQGNPADLVAQHNLTAENLLHAVKMGGIAVPSLAVTNKAHPLTNFGEITLLAPSEMVDPKGYAATKVFGADIYSPRYPKITYELTPAKLKVLKAQFSEGEQATGGAIELDELANRGAAELTNSGSVMWQFLTEQGITPDVKVKAAFDPKRTERLREFGFEKFFGNTDHQALMRDPEFQRLVISEQNDAYTQGGMPEHAVDFEDAKKNDPSMLMALARNPAYEMKKIGSQVEPDKYATRDSLRAQIRGTLDEQFSDYVRGKFYELGAKEKIFKGFNNNGDRKYTPHTLENGIKILKTELRGGESFNYGVGSLRAKFTPQFKSIEQIRKAKDRLMDKAGFEKVKTEVDNELVAISDSLGLSLDQTIEVLEDAPKMGAGKAIERALKDYKRSDAAASDESKVRVAEFLTKLKNLPTEYFEAKILRDVDLAEFKGAVVPEGVDPKVIEALNKRGVTDIRTYKKGDDADRAAKIGEFGNLFFQKARGQIAFANDITQQASVISMMKDADLSTFIHEGGHFFLEVQADLAQRITQRIAAGEEVSDGERSIAEDFGKVLDWMGVKSTPEMSAADHWAYLSLEEKRPHHESFARGFEAYAFEGKSPSLELTKMFQTFRSWLVNVYKAMLKSINAGKSDIAGALKVELSDEVRGVMDRMLATNEEIATAEAARNMGPLFATAEEGGMDLEAYQAYHDIGVQASMDATDELQAKGLKDMQWLNNARSRALKKLQKQHDALRIQIAAEVRAKVMAEPIYQAWAFLTAKGDKVVGDKPAGSTKGVNPEVDNLFTAIAKLGGLDRAEVKKLWGIDEKEKLESGVFGSPVVRKTGGASMDVMGQRLIEEGYLIPDEHGNYYPENLEQLFDDQRRGVDRFSIKRDMANAYGDAPIEVPDTHVFSSGKLRTEDLRYMYGTKDDAVWRKLSALHMTSDEGGLHPDVVAELFAGFSSGDQLVKALALADDPKQVVQEMTDQRMLEEHGDLATPAGLERAADAAVHNDARIRFVATELRALQHAMSVREKNPGQKSTVDVLAQAAKEYASQLIARLKVRDIKPTQYAAAEARAAKAAVKAKGDLTKQAEAKRNQLINMVATKEAYAAQDEVAAAVEYFKKFDGANKSLDREYREQIHALLERFDLRKATSLDAIDKRKSLLEWVESQAAQGLEPDIPADLLQEANRKHFKDMTVEEIRGLKDTIKQIEHLGRLKHKLLTAKDQREFALIVAEAGASIRDNGGPERTVQLEEPTGAMPWLEGFAAGHRKLASLLRQMDGGKDGGPLWRILGRTMNEAGTQEAVMVEQATVRLAEIYAPILDLKGGTHGDLLYIPEIKSSLTRGGRLSVALNWGNETNRSRVMLGDNWSEAQVGAILKHLTREEWAFVQNAWTFIDGYWPQIEAKQLRVTGVAPEKVAANPFSITLPGGEVVKLSGGYYPVKYDANRDDRAEKHDAAAIAKDMMQGAFTRATTRRGHTKARVEEVRRPVKKTLDVITQHVNQVVHDLSWHEWLIDANRLLDAKPINTAIRDHYGTAVVRTLKDSLQSIATADMVPQTRIDQALLHLRANISRSTMGLSLTTALMQPFGLTQSMARIGVKPVLRGMARWGGDAARFESSLSWINGKSDFMRLRGKTFNRELHEIKGRVSEGHSKARQIYDASLFILMQKMQMVADIPTWIGSYEKALAGGFDESTAVAMADQGVLDSQGGGQTKDLAEFQRKHPMLGMFYSYFNVTYNLTTESTARTDFKNPLAVAGWMADMMLLIVIPALAPALLIEMLRGGGDDDDAEKWAMKLLKWQAGYLLGTVMGLRETSGLLSGFDYAGPPVGRVISDLGKTGKQVAQGEADEALVLASVRLFGSVSGVPVTQIIRSYRGWQAWADGGAPATAILLGPPPKD
jgi:hypothetical protein